MKTRTLTRKGRAWTVAGIACFLLVATWLGAIGLFDQGKLAQDWGQKAIWILVLLIPVALALIGFGKPLALFWAGLITIALAFLTFVAFLFIPGAFFFVGFFSATRDALAAGSSAGLKT